VLDVSSDSLAPVYIISSGSPLLVERAVSAIRDAAVPESARGFNYDVVEGKGATASRILAAAQTLPMMAKRRMVFIRDLAPMPAAELTKLIPYLESPNPSTVLVAITSKLDKRIKFYQKAKKAKMIHELAPPRNVSSWIKAEIKARGANFKPNAASRLADVAGKDLARIALAIDQLSLYAGDRPVEVDDVDDLIADTRERSVFELTDAIGAGDLSRALAGVSSLCAQRQSAIGVVVMLARHMRQIGLVHVGQAERLGKGQMAKLVGAPPFVVDKLMGQARRYSSTAVATAAVALTEADRALKGQAPKYKTLGRQLGEQIVLHELVTRIVSLGERRPAPARARRR
jgi:DNA polymerase-3 subunit delta